MTDSFLRLPAVLSATGMTRATIYRRIEAGAFPRQVKIAPRTVAWRQSEIENWMQDPGAWTASA